MSNLLLQQATDTLVKRIDYKLSNTRSSIALNTTQKKILADSGIALVKLMSAYGDLLDTSDKIGIQQRVLEIADRFEKSAWSKYYVTFLRVSKADERSLDPALHDALYDILGTQLLFLASNYNYAGAADSIYNIFFERLGWVIKSCKTHVFGTSDSEEQVMPAYVLATITNTLLTALHNKEKEFYDTPSIEQMLRDCLDSIDAVLDGHTLWQKPALLAYLARSLLAARELNYHNGLNTSSILDFIAGLDPKLLSDYELSWVVIDLRECKHSSYKKFGEHLSIHNSFPDLSLAPFVLAGHYLRIDNLKPDHPKPISLGIRARLPEIEIGKVVEMFFPKIQESITVEVTTDEYKVLEKWKDPQLRAAIAEIIASNTILEAETRERALFESRKPHTGYEVSDMDVPLHLNGRLHYVCFPVKTGVEISDSVPIETLNQLIRPFIRYELGLCVFITVRRCSTPLRNDINNLRAKGIPIYVIEEMSLCKLLKVYDKLKAS